MRKMRDTLAHRFGAALPEIAPEDGPQTCPETWQQLAGRGSCRYFQPRRVAPALIETLCALALSSPTKSDLQQRDIVSSRMPASRRIDALLRPGPLAQDWIPGAPAFSFSAATTAGNVSCIPGAASRSPTTISTRSSMRPSMRASRLSAFVCGRGGGPRLRPHQRHPQPRAGGLGVARPAGSRLSGRGAWFRLAVAPASCEPAPAAVGDGTPRPLQRGRHRGTVDAYDRRRAAVAPIRTQRATDLFGTADFYGWSEDKVRQYARPERADWGTFVRKKGFRLE